MSVASTKIYYNNYRILRVCVCLSLQSSLERNVVAPLRFHQSGELRPASYNNNISSRHDACLERVKRLELFRWQRVKPRPSCYRGAILKKRVVFLKRFELFRLQLGRRKE